LNDLVDRKQKQASISEALSARKQAENTSRQADHAARQADSTAEQARIAAEQAAETTRQGKTILVFTVVTIIFVCSTLSSSGRTLTFPASLVVHGSVLCHCNRLVPL
jgi:hypothetical protein